MHTWPWEVPGDLYDAGKAAAAGAVDEARAVAAFAEFAALEAKALALQIASDVAHAAAKTAALLAKGADKAAQIAGKLADAAARTAQALEAVAERTSAAAASADSAFKSLSAAYARQEAYKLAKIAKATVRVLKKIGHAVKRVAVAVAKAAYKYSGAQDVVSCVTHPTLAGCAKAALTVALTVGTAGEGEVAEIGLNAAEHAGEDVAENAGEHAAEAGAAEEDPALSCTLNSFTGNTKVLLGNGKAIPISEVKAGEKVKATDPYRHISAVRPVVKVIRHHRWHAMATVVLVAGTVIQATSQHPVWDATTHRFTYAADLRPGDKLLGSGGQTVAVRTVRHYQADLTAYNLDVSGIHTYYVLAGATSVLVHNSCGDVRPVGQSLESVNDVMANPGLLKGMSPSQVESVIGDNPGWRAGVLGKGRSAGQGWTFRELNSRGTDFTDRYIQWHPGSLRHFGGNPYWKVSSGAGGTVRFPQ